MTLQKINFFISIKLLSWLKQLVKSTSPWYPAPEINAFVADKTILQAKIVKGETSNKFLELCTSPLLFPYLMWLEMAG